MARIGARNLPARRPLRRFIFLGLLLLAISAPAGWVMASEFSQPYVVLFDRDEVGAATSSGPATVATVQTFRQLAAGVPAAQPGQHVDRQRVVDHVREIAARSRVRIKSVYSSAVGGFAADLTAAQLRAVADDPAVSAVIPDAAVEIDDGSVGAQVGILSGVSNPVWQVPAGVRRIGARSSMVTSFTHRQTRIDADVAILDTGIDRDHPDLNVVGGYNCTSSNHAKWDDNEGHGTHVAGIVGALDNRVGVVGVAPGVRLWSIKVLDSQGRGFISWIVCGIDWVTSQRDPDAPARPLIEVANMSISFSLPRPNESNCGPSGHDAIHQAICRSVAAGTVYVVAAGNDSRNARRNRPAAYDEVITVSALADYDGRGGGLGRSSDSCPFPSPEPDDAFADFSNYGAAVDLIAPGRCVLSTYRGNRYAWMSGTSMATPHVAGAAAIYRAMFPRAMPGQVRLALLAVGTLDWRTGTDPDRDAHEKALWIGEFRHVPDFTLDVQPASGAVAPGGRLEIGVLVGRVGGFSEPVDLSLADPPAGLTAAPVVAAGQSATLFLDVASRARRGTYILNVVGHSGDVVRTVSIEVTVGRRAAPTPTGDTTPPRAPLVTLADTNTMVGLNGLALPTASIGASGTLWVRGATAGSVELRVAARDPESGISANIASVNGEGWQASWLGDSTDGRLVITYLAGAVPADLFLSSTNGAGLEGRATIGHLRTDAVLPPPAEWLSLPASTTERTNAPNRELTWTAGAADQSGLADVVVIRSYRAPLDRSGHFSPSGFATDGPYRLVASGLVEDDLLPGYCYVWAVRTLDNVGNAGTAAVSGYLIVERGG